MALLVTMLAIAALAGLVAWWVVGPRRAWALPLPVLAPAFALWLTGHRLGWSLGPQVRLYGYEVSLLLDVAVSLAVAFGAALVQRGLVRVTATRS